MFLALICPSSLLHLPFYFVVLLNITKLVFLGLNFVNPITNNKLQPFCCAYKLGNAKLALPQSSKSNLTSQVPSFNDCLPSST